MPDWTPEPGDRVLVGEHGRVAHRFAPPDWAPTGYWTACALMAWYTLRPAPEGTPECRKCWPARRET